MTTSVNIINNNFKTQDTLFNVSLSDISCGYTLLLIEIILLSLAIEFSDLFITPKLIQSEIHSNKTKMACIQVRYVLAGLIFIGTLLNYATRVTINIAILEMTRNASELCNGTSR